MGRVTLVLGAGASRGVSYAHQGRIPSPLDGDFFDLLQRLEPSGRDEAAVEFVLRQCSRLPIMSFGARWRGRFILCISGRTCEKSSWMAREARAKPNNWLEILPGRFNPCCAQHMVRGYVNIIGNCYLF